MATKLGRLSVVIGLALVVVLGSPCATRSDETVVDARTKPAQIVDSAGMFDRTTVNRAEQELDPIVRRTSVPVLIETVASLRGQAVEEFSLQRAIQTGREGLYILIAKDEHKLEVRVSRRYKATLDEATEKAIRDAFLSALRADPKQALESGVKSITPILVKAAQSNPPPSLAAHVSGDDGQPLVVRNQAKLTLAGARRIIAGAETKAAEMGLKVNIAVVDDGGHLLSFARMDGARPASGYTATTKAITAATFRQNRPDAARSGHPRCALEPEPAERGRSEWWQAHHVAGGRARPRRGASDRWRGSRRRNWRAGRGGRQGGHRVVREARERDTQRSTLSQSGR